MSKRRGLLNLNSAVEKGNSKKKRPMAEPEQQENGRVVREVLDCSVCFHPLKPPIFQCVVGHVICSCCYGKLVNKDMCQTCSTGGGYNRCFAVEHILDAVRVPCCHSERYGCAAVTRYHERAEHERSCPCAPCFCPDAGCDFAGSTAALLHHLAEAHVWPSTEFEHGARLTLQVQEGTQVLHSDDDGGSLFLVRFTLAPPFGVAVTVLCVDPHASAAERKFKCHLCFICPAIGLQQSSDFQVTSSNLSGGLLTEGGYSFVVPNVSCGAHTAGAITVSIVKIMRDKCGSEIQLNKRWRQSSLPPLFC